MLRQLQHVSGKNVDASFKSEVKTVRGRLVQKDQKNKTFKLATSQEGVYFLDKEQIPSGINVIFNNMSDYHENFEVVSQDEFALLVAPLKGERYATSEFVEVGLVEGDYLTIETAGGDDQGKLKKLDTGTSQFVYGGIHNDNGNELAIVEIV